MRRSFPTLVCATALLGALAGCSGSGDDKPSVSVVKPFVTEKLVRPKADATPTVEQAAIQALMEANRTEFNSRFEPLTAESSPADVKKAFAGYAEAMAKQDVAGCPLQFRAAFTQHLKDWKALTAALSRLPNAYEGVEFMDMLQSLFQSGSDRGKPLGADVVTGVKVVTKSLADLHSAAERAGMELIK